MALCERLAVTAAESALVVQADVQPDGDAVPLLTLSGHPGVASQGLLPVTFGRSNLSDCIITKNDGRAFLGATDAARTTPRAKALLGLLAGPCFTSNT